MKINIPDKTFTQMILTEDVRKLNMIEKNAVVTLAEEIGLHALHKYPCKYCLLLLFKEKIAKVFGCELVYTMNLKKNNAQNNIPTSNFIVYIRKLETVYHNNILNILHGKEVCKTFINIVHSNNIYFNFCCDCNNTNDYVICLFLNYQFKHLLSKDNLLYDEDTEKKCRKLLIIKHI